MDPREFHKLAARLATGSSAAEFRTASGRAQSNVKTAQQVIHTLDTAFRGPQRAALQAAITQWRRENGYP
jgi:hypothetical protein